MWQLYCIRSPPARPRLRPSVANLPQGLAALSSANMIDIDSWIKS